MLAALDSARYFALLDALDRLLADPPLTAEAARPAGGVLPARPAAPTGAPAGGCAGPGTRRPASAREAA